MTTQKHLAQQALDGISLVCSDLEMLHKELGRPAETWNALVNAQDLEHEIQVIHGLIEGE